MQMDASVMCGTPLQNRIMEKNQSAILGFQFFVVLNRLKDMLTRIVLVMVAVNKVDMSAGYLFSQSTNLFFADLEREIAENPQLIICAYRLIDILHQSQVHFVNSRKRAIRELYCVVMTEMQITGKIKHTGPLIIIFFIRQ